MHMAQCLLQVVSEHNLTFPVENMIKLQKHNQFNFSVTFLFGLKITKWKQWYTRASNIWLWFLFGWYVEDYISSIPGQGMANTVLTVTTPPPTLAHPYPPSPPLSQPPFSTPISFMPHSTVAGSNNNIGGYPKWRGRALHSSASLELINWKWVLSMFWKGRGVKRIC